ncbi:hypothetical protein [Jeotgalibacillus sp. R-1-5s-1]|uniref:hypothetical protein n=1 Tax=Jeotgalibacillus sp. R-1-5s-1 TaxID=2555897 RepID=UPI001101F4CE|nr:hypothetical protein [Jeotgalibacillus sp. R-1-5s-1]TFD94450.1 hypothetical protein E2491_13525 [Jeotgalibacillus sp. R-1-5s-1]
MMIAGVLTIAGCQPVAGEQIDIVFKTPEEQHQMLETFTYEDYKNVYDQAIAEAKTYDTNDSLKKFIIYTLTEEALYYETDLNQDQVIQLAEQQKDELATWIRLASEKYGVTVSDEELDEFISQGPDKSDLPEHQAFADALGLTLEELNHDYERDLYEKNLMWLELEQILKEEYKTSDPQQIIELFEEEVQKELGN